jgi:hypothetical protein
VSFRAYENPYPAMQTTFSNTLYGFPMLEKIHKSLARLALLCEKNPHEQELQITCHLVGSAAE